MLAGPGCSDKPADTETSDKRDSNPPAPGDGQRESSSKGPALVDVKTLTSVRPQPSDTPKEAVAAFMNAFKASDPKQLMATATGDAQQKRNMAKFARYLQATVLFRDDFVAEYGQKAWQRFNSPTHSPGKANATLTLNIPDDDILDNLQIDIQGDRAIVKAPGEPQPMILRKIKGGWIVDMETLEPAGGQSLDASMELMNQLAPIIVKYRKAIGKEGITPDDIDYELGREMAPVLTGMELPVESRFRIEDL
jgi:hypothetical protein